VDLAVFPVLAMGDVGGPFTYTGLPMTPQPNVYYGATLLRLDVNYTLSYANNVNAGTATVTVTGIGSYFGAQQNKNFTITKATPTATLAVNNSPKPYDGTALSATVGITASSVPGSVESILTGGAASQSSQGNYAVTANFKPNDTANYNTLIGLAAGNFQIQWAELILNPDGSINWDKYAYVASNYNRRDMIDYRFGPRYSNFHPTPETIPTMFNGADRMGFHLGGHTVVPWPDMNWYSEGGTFVISPDADAPTKWQPGVAQCFNGGVWCWFAPTQPEYSLLNRLMFDGDVPMPNQNWCNRSLPDPGPVSQLWINTSGGTVPAPPVTVVRTRARAGVTGYIIYKNGLIGVSGTGNEPYQWNTPNYAHRVCMKLPDGKVPTAAAVSGCNEFLFVTVWDSANRKGQMAVIALKGMLVAAGAEEMSIRSNLYGFPSWPSVNGMKLLGFVDLPFAAPMAIEVSQDIIQSNGPMSWDNSNTAKDLNTQETRNMWYNHSGSHYQRLANSGYAVVSSRAENKVAFIDLQPLFQFYRTMYFTTQANYDLTKNEGPADNQWPHTFTHAPAQTPTIYSTITVPQPTAVLCGRMNVEYFMRNEGLFVQNAYVASMDGQLRMYKVGDLMTTASGGSIGAPFSTVVIGKNPCSLDSSSGASRGDDLYIVCRGDNAVYWLNCDGSTRGILRDSRITDAVYVCLSRVGAFSQVGIDYAGYFLHLMDFNGRKVLNYRCEPTPYIPLGDPPNPPNTNSIFEFNSEQTVPGCPFVYTRAEII
jgi:hypothetical protein